MSTINVRRLDDELVRRLKRRAADNNRSLESEVRHILERAADDGMADRIASFRSLAKRLRTQTANRPQTPSQVLIREDRDSGHRTS